MDDLINKTISFVKETLYNAEAGHDWFHIERVYLNALQINKTECANGLVVALAALLHDIADPKFNEGDETIGPRIAEQFLRSVEAEENIIQHVISIIKSMSFKNSFDQNEFRSREMEIVQDADRLDAIGAIGIARAFTYGGFKNRVLYDPNVPPVANHTKQSYKSTAGPTINHFYEKLLLLQDRMNTESGKAMAKDRHDFMLLFLDQFYREWNGRQAD